jgi:single-strand DNA-binding protein
MATLNKTMMIGRLTGDPDAPRVLPNTGNTLVKFRFAVGRSRKNPQTGQWENLDTMYIDCEVYSRPDTKRNLCEVVSKYVKKGDELYLEGRIQLDEWEDKAGGGRRSKHKIVVDEIQLLGGKGGGGESQDDGEQQPRQQQPQQQQKPSYSPPPRQATPVPDDSIPF